LYEQFFNRQERCRFSPPEDGTAGFAGPASKKSEKEARALRYGKVAYTFFGAKKLRIMINNKVKVVGPGPSWCLAPCRPGLNQFKDQGTLKKK